MTPGIPFHLYIGSKVTEDGRLFGILIGAVQDSLVILYGAKVETVKSDHVRILLKSRNETTPLENAQLSEVRRKATLHPDFRQLGNQILIEAETIWHLANGFDLGLIPRDYYLLISDLANDGQRL